tara:strand:- start:51 stop:215 length:165 start_codon:yes stop_codon:yes gene_type:complete
MGLKEQIAKSQRISQVKEERQIYLDAINSEHRFSYYYATKVPSLSEEIERLEAV